MAVIQNPIIGRAKQKFSNAIFSTWLGVNVLRSKPLSVANPRTENQIVNRNRIGFLGKIAKGTRQMILKTLAPNRGSQTQYNRLVAINYPEFSPFSDGSIPEYAIAPRFLEYTPRTLDISEVTYNETTRTLSFSAWNTARRINTDMYVVYYNEGWNVITEEPLLAVEYMGEGVGNTMTFTPPAGAESAAVVLYDRVTRESNSFRPTQNL